ncbi:hypothetical protein [Candidatus Thiodiazotropha sp. CDECU1]|uniref:hypothetical protein n=1 Tax=Candidatus Thiodiazotropha sp. CDECU1 TaxID=3065865 RepID=UPI00292CD582|nr:hypothetical protein [Candidatus Thiodiazotropha sp. CDECU1]
MGKDEIVAIAVRLFSVALAIYGLKNLPGMVAYFNQEEMQGAVYAFTGITVLIFVIALLLWHFPLSVAKKIIPKNNSTIKATEWNSNELLICGLIILGVYFLFYVVSDAIYWFYVWKYSISFEGSRIELNIDQVASIYATIGEFVVVIILLLGSSGIANLIMKLRHAGINPSNQSNPAVAKKK